MHCLTALHAKFSSSCLLCKQHHVALAWPDESYAAATAKGTGTHFCW